ncbi:hypothetical protein IHE45_13G049600 [Dioscorea alata]|uniref:Uncharacterized protein n=1 Tax=Dioscorea alata TaxID=55571 RepID=A0ACB7UXV2_DIOAL|nr:hypothetical protein IHE45_13G049600 [Dioscorea alata]
MRRGTTSNKCTSIHLLSIQLMVLARLQHGHLEHADGNGDWGLTIFTALSFLLDILEFIPSHVALGMKYLRDKIRRKGLVLWLNLCILA